MANELTGDFDVVAQFSLPAVNRLLAAMHAIGRFPHSLALRVDDIPEPKGPIVFEVVDSRGDPVGNLGHIPLVTTVPLSGPVVAALDTVVNGINIGLDVRPLEPSALRGRAQLQFSPPALELADAAASRIAVRMAVRARYAADPNSPPVAQFARGDLVLSTSVQQITSQVGSVVGIDLRSPSIQVAFIPAFTSEPLSPQDRAGIDLLLKNAIRSSTEPSNTTLPAGTRAMRFKALAVQGQQAIAIMVNTDSPAGNPATVQRVFLTSSDFGFAVGVDSMQRLLTPIAESIRQERIPDFPVPIDLLLGTLTATYSVTINDVQFALETGRIALRITGRATSPQWYAPNFNFTVTQNLELNPAGSTARLTLGDMSFDTDDAIVGLLKGLVEGRLRDLVRRKFNDSGARAMVRQLVDAHRNLGPLVESLLTPPRPTGQPQPIPHGFSLRYTEAEITPAGIALRGTFEVAALAQPHLEFEEIRPPASDTIVGAIGSEFTAFKSWIPGGTIDSFRWRRPSTTVVEDVNRFVLFPEEPVISTGDSVVASGPVVAFRAMCLELRGMRLSTAGPIAPQPLSATYCAYPWFPILDSVKGTELAVPLVPLTRPGARGEIEIVGHAAAARTDRGTRRPNLIVHFGDERAESVLKTITTALEKAARSDAPTAVVSVTTTRALAHQQHLPGVVYLDDDDGRWQRMWQVATSGPVTIVLAPNGQRVWEHEGELNASTLEEALRKVLVSRKRGRVGSVEVPAARIGHAPPNFVFSPSRDVQLTLRKLIGQPVTLVFWRADARVSVDLVRQLAAGASKGSARVLAIDDGGDGGAMKSVGTAASLVTVVPDPRRAIAAAYGVHAWPTVVSIDERGVVRTVQLGTSPAAGGTDSTSYDAAGA